MKKNKGFTLIELLAVIVILGIMLAISVVAVNKIRRSQEKENIKNVVSSILTGAKRYVSENRDTLNNLPAEIDIIKIKNGNFVDFDETNKSISELKLTNKKVNVKTCEKNSLKLLYYTESINGVVYNDCGCSDQFVNESSAKICKGSSCRYDSKTKLTICDPVD